MASNHRTTELISAGDNGAVGVCVVLRDPTDGRVIVPVDRLAEDEAGQLGAWD